MIFLLNDGATALQNATQAGTGFVFGYLGGPPLPFAETHPGASFILAFQALPLVLTISALASLLFYWGVLQRITAAFAWLLRRAMGIGGALALGAAVHVFVGMIEAPLLVRPYLARMQRGELFALMTCGMAGVAGTVMVIYAVVPRTADPERAGQHPDRIGDQHAGRTGDRGADGAVRSAPRQPRNGWSCTIRRISTLDALVKGTRRRRSSAGRHRRDAAGGGRVRRADQHGAGPAAALGRRGRSRCNASLPGRSVR